MTDDDIDLTCWHLRALESDPDSHRARALLRDPDRRTALASIDGPDYWCTKHDRYERGHAERKPTRSRSDDDRFLARVGGAGGSPRCRRLDHYLPKIEVRELAKADETETDLSTELEQEVEPAPTQNRDKPEPESPTDADSESAADADEDPDSDQPEPEHGSDPESEIDPLDFWEE